jgi:alpha-galactosidase
MDKWKDCFARYGESGIEIGNDLIRRRYRLEGPVLCVESVDAGDYCWQGDLRIGNLGLDTEGSTVSFASGEDDRHGLSEPFFYLDMFRVKNGITLKIRWTVCPGHPFISSQMSAKSDKAFVLGNAKAGNAVPFSAEVEKWPPEDPFIGDDVIDGVALSRPHLKITAVRLGDKSDINDNLVLEENRLIYPGENTRLTGNFFVITDYYADHSLILVKEAPSHMSSLMYPGYDLSLPRNKRYALLAGSGMRGAGINTEETFAYGSTLGTGSGDMAAKYKRYYRAMSGGVRQRRHYVMSNTWGDRSQDAALSQDFIMRELDCAAELGVDIVQIDDGWQQGITSNSALKKGGVFQGYYAHDPDFWKVNKEKFPRGLAPLAVYARDRGIELGLWFSPDSSGDFTNWEKDAALVLDFYRNEGIRYFKLDGVLINSKTAERHYVRFLETVAEQSRGDVGFNQDITNDNRFGVLYYKHQGTLFVENRYTDWGNYYPHRTLRNLWQMTRYFPPERFQFELLNNRRNPQKYADTPLAPKNYPIDYLFASVMIANPLVWMEMSRLEEADRKGLAKIIRCYRSLRDDFRNADTYPIGEEPLGLQWTGFEAVCAPGKVYLLLFRESGNTERFTYTLPVPVNGGSTAELVMSNLNKLAAADIKWSWDAGRPDLFTLTLPLPRSYAVFRF